MPEKTGIEWTDSTVNFWIGCQKVSQGCKFCYAERDMTRYGRNFRQVTRTSNNTFYAALKWKEGRKIFTNSWSDFFIEDADDWRQDAWDVIRQTPQHTWQILTKRPERVLEHLPNDWGKGWDNVWLGTSVENQQAAEERIPILLKVLAKVRFLSCEPLLSELNLARFFAHSIRCENRPMGYEPDKNLLWDAYNAAHGCNCPKIHWVIAGGESGAKDKIRPAQIDWFRAIRNQCQKSDVAFFFKQHGGSSRIDGIWGGRDLDDRTWDEFPTIKPKSDYQETMF